MTDLNSNCEFQDNISCFDNFLDSLITINYQAIRFLNLLFCIDVKNEETENVMKEPENEVVRKPEVMRTENEVETVKPQLKEFKTEEVEVKEIEDLHGFVIIEDSKQD